MRVLITGICGFVGSTLALGLRDAIEDIEVAGVDNFIRPGSERNRLRLRERGIRVGHADVRQPSDFEALPAADWVIDAAANPSVLAGVDGKTSSRQIVEHNLFGTVNVLEYCRRTGAGFILLSTSRIYSMPGLAALPLRVEGDALTLDTSAPLPPGASAEGVDESFSTAAPLSLYGATKLASEQLAQEYSEAFEIPIWINRCGVLAGAGQFARPDQGIFAYWIHSWAGRRALKYIGFGGRQVRDCLHPADLVPLLRAQIGDSGGGPRIYNVSGGRASAVSLRECSEWCARRFGPHQVDAIAETRRYDAPWIVLDSRAAAARWRWTPTTSRDAIFSAIADHADRHPDWLELSAV